MFTKRTLFVGLSLVMVIALVLSGCAPTPTPAKPTPKPPEPTAKPPEPTAKPAEPTKLTFATSLAEEEWAVMRDTILPAFEAANNVEVEAIEVGSGDMLEKLKAMSAAGKMEIDVFGQDNMQLAPLVAEGVVEDLSAYEAQVPDGVLPALVNAGRFEGTLYFLPYRPNMQLTYYNEAKFQEYGLDVPSDWDELLAVAKVFKEKEGIGKIGFKAVGPGGPTACQLYEWVVSAGGDPLTLNDKGCANAFTYLQELWPYMSPDSKTASWDTTNDYLLTESFYWAQNWPFATNVIVKDGGKEEIKAYHGVAGPVTEAHVVGGEVIGIPKGAPNRDLAIKFWQYLVSKEAQEKLVSDMGWPAVRSDAYGTVEAWRKPYDEQMGEALKYGIFRANIVWWDDFDKAFTDAFREIVMEGADVKATLDKYHDVIEAARE